MKLFVTNRPVNSASSATKWCSSGLPVDEVPFRRAVNLSNRRHEETFLTAVCCRQWNDSRFSCGWKEFVAVPELESRFGLPKKSSSNGKQGLRNLYTIAASSNNSNKTGREENSHRCLDAVLVLAGGQLMGGGVPLWVERRLDKALDLQRNNGAVCRIVCLGGGTPHKLPILSSKGFVVHESSSCVEYLHRRGASFSQLLKEWGSYDTIGNGYFSLTQHAIPRAWRKLAVVTSAFHMPRTKAVFEWIYGLQGAGTGLVQGADNGVAATGSRAQGFELEFHSVTDADIVEERIMEARRRRELRAMENLSMLVRRIHTLQDFHEWLHTEHKAYNSRDQHLFGDKEPYTTQLH